MAPLALQPTLNSRRPTSLDYFVNSYKLPIFMGMFSVQTIHNQYILRTVPAIAAGRSTGIRGLASPRFLRAGIAWAAAYGLLLVKISLADRAIQRYRDPLVVHPTQERTWKDPVHGSETSDELF